MPVGGTAAFGINQHPRITTLYLNDIHRFGDAAPGLNVSTAEVSGSIVQPYAGFEGGKLTITDPFAKQFSDPEVGPLYGGVYQYVQFDPLMTTPAQRGAICFWVNNPLGELLYVVTTDYDPVNSPKIAGVIVNPDRPGRWDFIQISGIASVMFTAAGTVGTPVAAVPTAGSASFAQAGGAINQNFLGIAVLIDPQANVVSPVQLNMMAGWNY